MNAQLVRHCHDSLLSRRPSHLRPAHRIHAIQVMTTSMIALMALTVRDSATPRKDRARVDNDIRFTIV